MSLVSPSITNASFTMTFNIDEVSPAATGAKLTTPFTFSGMTFLRHASGTYTPANDTQTIFTFDSTTRRPTFFLFKCDVQANLLLQLDNNNVWGWLPVKKFIMFACPAFNTRYWHDLTLDGETNSGGTLDTPMAQGVACHWSLWLSDGTIA